MFEWVLTIMHALLSVCMVIGVLFSRTTISMVAVLATLLLLLCMIRYFGGCLLTEYERVDNKPSLSDMGLALSLKEDTAVSRRHFEEIVVVNLLIIHLIGMFSRLILPLEVLF